jgi:hypothetical protein
MKKNLSYLSAALCLFAAVATSASAATFLMRFEVTNFGSLNDNPPPTDPVTGTIMWEAAEIHAPILSIDSIDMTIAGHPYSIGEITYVPPGYPEYDALIGGSLSGPFTMNDRTDDFWIRWETGSLLPYDFAYTSSATSGVWHTLDWGGLNPSGSFSIIEVPEPSTTAIWGVFVFLAAMLRSRQRKSMSSSMPNPAASGNGATALMCHAGCQGLALPERYRSATES